MQPRGRRHRCGTNPRAVSFAGLFSTTCAFTAFAAALVVAPGGVGWPARAEDDFVVEEGPVYSRQTNLIESLTPAKVKWLLAEFDPGEQLEVEVSPRMLVTPGGDCLYLNGLKALDADTAVALAKGWKGSLMLGGLTSLDADAARALETDARVNRGEMLSVFGLTSLDAGTAKVLAGTRGWDGILSRLTTLEADVATALAAFEGQLYLDGLTELSPEAAEALVRSEASSLHLNGLTGISPEAAEGLGRCGALNLHLNGVKTLSAAAASALARFGREGSSLHLTGLTTLDAETAKALAASKAWTGQLPYLERLDAATAAAFVEFLNAKKKLKNVGLPIVIGGLTRLDGETARTLDTLEWVLLEVPRLTTLSVDTATALAGCRAWWSGSLPGITALDSPDAVAIATALATRRGRLSLPNLEKISPDALSALVEKEDVQIPPIKTLELTTGPGGISTDDFVLPEGFARRQEEELLRRQKEQQAE